MTSQRRNEKRSLSFFIRFFFSLFYIYIYISRPITYSKIILPLVEYEKQEGKASKRASGIRRIGWELLSERNKFAIDANLGIKKKKKKSWKLQWLITSRYLTLRKANRKKEETLFRNDGSFVAKKSEKSLYDASPINRENYSRPKAIR